MLPHLLRHRSSQERFWFRAVATAAVIGLLAGPAAAQDETNTRPSGVTFLGDTGLWFVPTAEVMASGNVSGSGQHTTFNREAGFSAIQTSGGTFAIGVGGRAELFASIPLITRIDRDVRPLFRSGNAGSLDPDYPLATQQFSGSAMGDVMVGVKVNLMSEQTQAPAAVAFRGWARLPTGNESAGTSAGALGGGVGLVVSKAAGNAEVALHGEYQFRASPDNVTVPQGFHFGVGVGAPLAGSVRVFGEVLASPPLGDSITLRSSLTAHDGSMTGLSLPTASPLDLIAGVQVQSRGVAFSGGISYALSHASRSTYDQSLPSADRLGLIFRLSYHPGVPVYTPPPPPPPPPPPNRPPTVSVSCDPCEVLVDETVNLRADASDPDGDALTYRWNAPAGQFTGGSDRATTTWQAPGNAGPVPVSVTVSDGNGGSASDTANITVNAPPPPPQREWMFEDVHFDFDRYTLRPLALEVLNALVEAMMEDPAFTIQLEGHTCNIGTNEYNLALGDRRADAVESYLTGRGVDASRLQTISYGEERPAHDNAREETRRLNRRAALVVRLQQ